MSDQSSAGSEKAGTPSRQGTPRLSSQDYDQMQVFSSLMEIQSDLGNLKEKTDRLIADVNKLDGHVDTVRTKIGRAEGIFLASAAILAFFGGLLTWLFDDRVDAIRSQLFEIEKQTLTEQDNNL
ncbi:MAG: hypothetical protein AAF850_08440 [Pseudomonadota bacterium]